MHFFLFFIHEKLLLTHELRYTALADTAQNLVLSSSAASAASLLCGPQNPAIPNADILLTVVEHTHDSPVAKSSICYVGGEKANVKIMNPANTGDIEADEIGRDSCIEVVHHFANDTSLKCATESAFSNLVNLH
jgi:hypothetical protein